MHIKFCGAAQFVTGSSHLITLNDGYKILLDCGLFQGKGKNIWEKNNQWLFDPKSIDCLILSHAHIDHSGRIPKLVRDGFKGKIYTTHATRSLCSIMLLDSAKIQERDVEWHNRKNKKRNKKKKNRSPLYTAKDIGPTMERFVGYGYGEWNKIRKGIDVKLQDAGHLLGSANVTLRIKEKGKYTTIGFTGDIGRPDRPMLRDPQQMPKVDYLITESTYGDKNHEGNPEQSDRLLQVIKDACVKKKGKLIIPAFSLGRTQEIVYMLDKMETAGILPKLPIYVDSPLAINATHIFGAHPECFDDDLNEYLLIDDNPFGFNDLHYIRDVEDSKKLNKSKKPCIIISSSGMMNAGRVKHHLFNNIEDPKNTFLIVGYCTPDSPGGMLRRGVSEIKLFREMKQVRANIEIMDSFSAHADRTEMRDHISNQKDSTKQIFLVHGDPDTQIKYKKYLKKGGFKNILIPKQGDVVQLV